jgi:hypothetical protein
VVALTFAKMRIDVLKKIFLKKCQARMVGEETSPLL